MYLFQLVGRAAMELGDAPYSPGQASWLGMGEVIDLHGAKGLMVMAAMRTSLTCCVSTSLLSAQLSPTPDIGGS